MRILFDTGVPRGVAALLREHTVEESRLHGWQELSNGKLIAAAEEAQFDVLLTTDKNIRYQQNLEGRRLAIVVLGNGQWPNVKLQAAIIVAAVNAARPGSYQQVEVPYRDTLESSS